MIWICLSWINISPNLLLLYWIILWIMAVFSIENNWKNVNICKISCLWELWILKLGLSILIYVYRDISLPLPCSLLTPSPSNIFMAKFWTDISTPSKMLPSIKLLNKPLRLPSSYSTKFSEIRDILLLPENSSINSIWETYLKLPKDWCFPNMLISKVAPIKSFDFGLTNANESSKIV